MAADKVTDHELSQSSLPSLPFRLSQRRSTAVTDAGIAPRSYEGLRPWPSFSLNAAALSEQLDNQEPRKFNPMVVIYPLDEAADEIGVRVPVVAHIFPITNYLATRLGLIFRYKEGGSGRSLSSTDLLILDSCQPQPAEERKQLSRRVFGNGEAQGNWQCTLEGFSGLDAALLDQKKGDRLRGAIQQLFGDMVLDETKYGWLTEYNYTVFFRRVAGTKILEYSPIVTLTDAPIEKYLYVLSCAETDKFLKLNFSRLTVKDTPPEGYRVVLPQQQGAVTRSGRVSPPKAFQVGGGAGVYPDVFVYEEEDFSKLHTYDMMDLGITGSVTGMGKYGNVLEGCDAKGKKLALKLFDLRKDEAASALVREQKAYSKLKLLQGSHVPQLVAVGRMPHMNVVFLALTDEGGSDVVQMLTGRNGDGVERKILKCLEDIHAHGILHNDIKLSHILWKNGTPKFIDFDTSLSCQTRDAEMTDELNTLEETLAEARNHEI